MKASIQNSFLPLKLPFRCTGRFNLKRRLDFLTHIERTCKQIARTRNVTREYERNKSSYSEKSNNYASVQRYAARYMYIGLENYLRRIIFKDILEIV